MDGRHYQLTQVFCNLLINAYEALEGRGRIDISARIANTATDGALLPDGHLAVPTVVVDIADDGPGMPADIAEKIFNPFFTTKDVGKGTGLGLDITRRIVVDRHAGDITFVSRPGATTAVVRLSIRR